MIILRGYNIIIIIIIIVIIFINIKLKIKKVLSQLKCLLLEYYDRVQAERCLTSSNKSSNIQYHLKISEPSNEFATCCKLRNALLEKIQCVYKLVFSKVFGLCYSILTPLGCVVGMLKSD